jgi:hypothetical protein
MNGNTLKNWRMNQKPKFSRMKVAEELSQMLGRQITTAIVRDIEEERSAKWVKEYEDWAKAHWKESTRPLTFDTIHPRDLDRPLERGVPDVLLHVLDTTSKPAENWKIIESDEWWPCPFLLPDDYSLYIFVQINGSGLKPAFPHASVLVFKSMTVPPIGSVVLRKVSGAYEIGFLTSLEDNVQMKTFSSKNCGFEGMVFGALLGIFRQWEMTGTPSPANIEWNGGRPIMFTDDCRGLLMQNS